MSEGVVRNLPLYLRIISICSNIPILFGIFGQEGKVFTSGPSDLSDPDGLRGVIISSTGRRVETWFPRPLCCVTESKDIGYFCNELCYVSRQWWLMVVLSIKTYTKNFMIQTTEIGDSYLSTTLNIVRPVVSNFWETLTKLHGKFRSPWKNSTFKYYTWYFP